MQRYLSRFFSLCFFALLASASYSQDTTVTSVDPDLLALQNAKVPKEYTINSVRVTGLTTLDTAIVLSISGIQKGDKVTLPGGDIFSKAIANLWRQRFFSNVQIYITDVSDDRIGLEINVQERAKLGNFKFVGVKKSEAEELQGKAGLVKQTIITENTRRNAIDAIRKYYTEKGFMNVQVRIEEKPDPTFKNSNSLTFYVTKNDKVKVNEINFYGNETVGDLQLKKQLKGTKEMTKFTIHPIETPSTYGTKERMKFGDYIKDWGFLSL